MKIKLNGNPVETRAPSLMDFVKEQGLTPLSLIAFCANLAGKNSLASASSPLTGFLRE